MPAQPLPAVAGRRQFGRDRIAKRAVHVFAVVLTWPSFEYDPAVLDAPGLLEVEALVAEPGMEALAVAVLPWLGEPDAVGRGTDALECHSVGSMISRGPCPVFQHHAEDHTTAAASACGADLRCTPTPAQDSRVEPRAQHHDRESQGELDGAAIRQPATEKA